MGIKIQEIRRNEAHLNSLVVEGFGQIVISVYVSEEAALNTELLHHLNDLGTNESLKHGWEMEKDKPFKLGIVRPCTFKASSQS